ncbi:BREX system Lon protease-like protein BrxL [Photobacterium leiognathi]|uniref:BREX system Lon protease-like protein BrxL n=1 Tax=Photobacterium leiognathi TaxID=553611 RepID=UPI002981FA23|nr:BREX system Lon protease-like protein BrxL [Photobacterium leiognathi]
MNEKIEQCFGEIAINKKLVADLKLRESRTIPSFVEEWLVAKFSDPSEQSMETRRKITSFMAEHLPSKNDKEKIKWKLSNGNSVVILDKYTIRIDLKKGLTLVTIPSLDLTDGLVSEEVIHNNPEILVGGQWGAGRLQVVSHGKVQAVQLIDFKPMQSGKINLEQMVSARKNFSTSEWVDVLVRTMGCEPSAYSDRQKRYLILRLLPMIQNNLNMMELAPKGTGKSFIFSNLSRYVWLNSGGALSEAQLFYNLSSKQLGLMATNDVLVLDEGQSIQFKGESDIHAKFKAYLESGEFSRGAEKVTSECGLMILANIELHNAQPKRLDFIRELPKMFHDDALLDRFHGIIPGWEIPRFTKDKITTGIGLKADAFGEYLHQLRSVSDVEFPYGKTPIFGGDIRDTKAVERISSALSKLLMLNPEDIDYEEYVLKPALELRTMVRQQISFMNPSEFSPELNVTTI